MIEMLSPRLFPWCRTKSNQSIGQSASFCPPGENDNYYNLAQNLRRSITDMKIKIDSQMRILAALKDRVKDQVSEMQKLEVKCL